MKAGQVIWKQLSVSTKMSVGARKAVLIEGGRGLRFNVLRGNRTFLEIILNGADLYDIKLYRLKNKTFEVEVKEEHNDVFVENLNDVVYHTVNK